MSGWCDWLGHHFVEPFWPWGKTRCLHCGITEQNAAADRLQRVAARLREDLDRLRAEEAARKPHQDAVIARAEEVLTRTRESVPPSTGDL